MDRIDINLERIRRALDDRALVGSTHSELVATSRKEVVRRPADTSSVSRSPADHAVLVDLPADKQIQDIPEFREAEASAEKPERFNTRTPLNEGPTTEDDERDVEKPPSTWLARTFSRWWPFRGPHFNGH